MRELGRVAHAFDIGMQQRRAVQCVVYLFHVQRPRVVFFFNDAPTTEIYTLSLHDALPISSTISVSSSARTRCTVPGGKWKVRSEEHTSELQSRVELVCRLLLEKRKASSWQG